ncbi:hypothetical protein BD410DRAFT_782122 [Rickenella mellea]|uniref:Uncharacterized protein n=1 Tax=Rickenella mellea TaxID=50990 RepID=A0A4Y7QKH8_9AGAM|nr:hypothetical protein BD410DRAFT_782122 [Rickenella mellea]
MEEMLLAQTRTLSQEASERESKSADKQDEDQGFESTRDRYQRLFWEPVAEHESPVVPSSIERGEEEKRRSREEARAYKSGPFVLTRRTRWSPHRPRPGVVYARSGRNGNRPMIKFVDVGGKFIDIEDRLRRIRHGEKRVRAYEKRART